MDLATRSSAEATRHQILEGLLARLGEAPEKDGFVLRGGMLMRLWFQPTRRIAHDLDLVATFPFDIKQAGKRLRSVLGIQSIQDGVAFDREKTRVDGIWLDSDCPGVRLFGRADVDGAEHEFSVDVTFAEPLVPPPRWAAYPIAATKHSAVIQMCRPETIVGRKLHAVWNMGVRHWRPKDLQDLRLLLARLPMDDGDLRASIAASFTSRGEAASAARKVFGPESWWTMKTSTARWQDFVARGVEAPLHLGDAVAEVAERLRPVLEMLA